MPKHKIANRAAWDRILESRIATALYVSSINQSQFDLAHREAKRIMTELRTGYADVITYAKLHYQQLLSLVK